MAEKKLTFMYKFLCFLGFKYPVPKAIVDALDLKKPIYKSLAAYGHVGREDLHVKWECTDKADVLLTHIKNQ